MIARSLVLLFLVASLHAATAPLAVVVRSKGSVVAGPEAAMKPVAAGTVLLDGSRLRTGADGRALVRFLADQSITEIKPGTVVDFATRERGGGQGTARQVLLRAGEAAFGVTPGKGRDLRFETATTVASVRGTGFDMKAFPDGATEIRVDHGVVRVCNVLTGETRDIYPGQGVRSTWDGFDSDSTSGGDLGSPADSASRQRLEIDFLEPTTGVTKTLGITTTETRR